MISKNTTSIIGVMSISISSSTVSRSLSFMA